MSDQEVTELVEAGSGADGRGPRALRSPPKVLDELANEREIGYCFTLDEVEAGLTSVVAPVRDSSGRVLTSLNVSGPTSRAAHRIDTLAATARLTAAVSGGRTPTVPG